MVVGGITFQAEGIAGAKDLGGNEMGRYKEMCKVTVTA